ncbi:MAG: hypothetical protein ABEH43_01340, partial [Flavobacteriales bacterium]
MFKWSQGVFSDGNFDNWALDNVKIKCASPSVDYNWSPGKLVSDSTISNPTTSPDTTTTFTLTATDTGCTVKDSVEVAISNINLNVTDDTTVCQGDTLILSASS